MTSPSPHLWIEADDFMEVPVPKYKRLTPPGAGVPPEGRVSHHLHRLREGRGRQRHRGAVHL